MDNNHLLLIEKRLVTRFLDMFIRFGLILALASFCFTVFSPFINMMLWALILAVAGITTLLFKRLKQPVVLGYVVAGFLCSGNFLLKGVSDMANVDLWAQIGIIFLLFSLGLEFSFKTRQYLSDYYVENASFLKLDNLSLSYNVGKINKWASLTVSAMVQNVFTITGYSGTDPEVPNGMDNSFYPRPRTYSVSLGLQF